MPRKFNQKIGLVRLKELRPGYWRIQYRSPTDGRYVRQTIAASDRAAAEELARKQDEALKEGRGFLPRLRRSGRAPEGRRSLTVQEAMTECIKSSRANERTKLDYRSAANRFLAWLNQRHPALVMWRDLRPLHIEQFVQHLTHEGKSHTTIRLYLLQVKSTSRFMHLNYEDEGCRNVGAAVRMPAVGRLKEPVILEASDLDVLLSFVEESDARIFPMVLLQACCGLRVREALALREEDVDLSAARTVTVTETPIHRPKTAGSYRTLPVPFRVASAIEKHIAEMRVRPMEGYLFVGRDGKPWTDWGYCGRLRRDMKLCAQADGPAALLDFAPRRLRATFATLAEALGAEEGLLARYLGHSRRDILGLHYLKPKADELRRIPALFDHDWLGLSGQKKAHHCT